MTYRGKVQKGVIVLEDPKALAEGTLVNVEPVVRPTEERKTVGERMMQFAGIMKGDDLPTDGANNHDHYIYGSPKE